MIRDWLHLALGSVLAIAILAAVGESTGLIDVTDPIVLGLGIILLIAVPSGALIALKILQPKGR